jgi:electron transfer flavoprotein-quinone oxidoreductase
LNNKDLSRNILLALLRKGNDDIVSNDRFDAIIIGGGIAGLTAAYVMAREGLEVLLVERGNYCGSKNMTGGRIYSHSLRSIFPNFANEAPVERRITREKISMMTNDSIVTADFNSPALGLSGSESYSVLRGAFDQWLAEQAEKAGAAIVTGIRVDDLIMRSGKVCGIIAGGDEMEANLIILADGVNSIFAQKLAMRREIAPQHVAAGAKEIISLPASVIEDRFQCEGMDGTAWLFAGQPSNGQIGGGFIYTNRESISLGVVCTLSELAKGSVPLPQLVENFKQHPAIAMLVKGGRTVEYSGHLVPEGGFDMMPPLTEDAVIVTGDAAGFCINIGYMVRGMDFAVRSGELAARTAIRASEAANFSSEFLKSYEDDLKSDFVLQDLYHYRKFPHFLEMTPRIFTKYPTMITDFMADMFRVDGAPAQPLLKKAGKHLKTLDALHMIQDLLKGIRAL